MTAVKHEQIDLTGITLHAVETKKYKTNTIVLKCKAPLTEETVTMRALLPYVLQSGTEKNDTRAKLRSALEELYGATFTVDLSKKGENHIITFRMDVANEKFLSEKNPLLKDALKLFAEVICQPLVSNGAFSETIVKSEKRALKQRIQAIYDDKMRYANMRLLQEMCATEPYRLDVHGTVEAVDQITPESLYDYYEHMLSNDSFHLYVVGDINLEEVKQYVGQLFSINNNHEQDVNNIVNVPTRQSDNVVFEEQDIQQGKLHIGYRTNVTYSDALYYPLQVFNGIFGGFSHSKLFINVREKASLAYYAASRVESHKGLLLVLSGIEFANYERAVQIIKEQMEEMRNGNFTDEEISQTKSVIKNQLLETVDNARGAVELLYHNVIANTSVPFEETLRNIEDVTKEQIIEVAKKIELDTVYFLKGKEA
jgi:predicted Zn-dependent peptidase